MIITKYNQSCLLIETNGVRILIDPGTIGYDDAILSEWTNINYILVSHKHNDHCNKDAINSIVQRDKSIVYTTSEVINNVELHNSTTVKAGDIIDCNVIKIEVVKAVHGFFTKMKYGNGEIFENVGFIIDDGKTRLYFTSDTINFNHNYKCDILCMPFNGNGLTLGIIDGVMFAKDINPKIVLVIHTEHPIKYMNPEIGILKTSLENENINYKILELKESIELK